MNNSNAHRKETILFLGGAIFLLVFVFGGIILLRVGLIGNSIPTAIPTKNVNQVVMEMNSTITAQVNASQQAVLKITATTVALTAHAPTPTITSTATPEPSVGSSKPSPIDGMILAYVPSGLFLMGSGDTFSEAEPQEKPQHKVYLDGFWIDLTEVTQGMYKQCIASGGCTDVVHDLETNSNFVNSEYDDHPVIFVSWFQAKTYCEKVGRRLPTEAEWEKAARGSDGRLFPWGNTPPNGNQALFDFAINGTRPIGRYTTGASPYGILDLVGNVREWVSDFYSATYYAKSPERNPQGPEKGESRVLKGASWKDAVHFTHAATRFSQTPGTSADNIGFRCASSR
jgi:formylglycine-generating enzyme required for sulfatase activity